MDTTVITLGQLESHLWEAVNILRGPVDAADFKTYVFPLLFFKRITRVATWEEIRAKDGNLSIPLYVAPAVNGGAVSNPAAADKPQLADTLAAWMKSSGDVRQALGIILERRP